MIDRMFKFILHNLGKIGIVLVLLFMVGCTGACYSVPRITKDVITVKVKEKERVNTSFSSKYLIFTETEVLTNDDDFFIWKFDSSDLYGDIEEGKTYKFYVYGWRIPFLSWYRNITKIEEIKEPETKVQEKI
jgi:hypothetical protein